ncbi:MAG: UDP-N-acetylmuramoyl-L-alanine--D-glutamate ligase [Candidatus Omnitrophota bacterium]
MANKATVIGLGISGEGAALFLKRRGWDVRLTESGESRELKNRAGELSKEGIAIELGVHTRDFIKGSGLVIKSPGVTNEAMPVVWAKELGIPVIGDIELGFRYCPAKIVAVTGTNGKSTTTTLIGEILKRGGRDAIVCGNIGESFCGKLSELKKESIAVIEVSSFQLQDIESFRPYVSVVLNITQNHLDRHADFDEYINAKLRILENQKDGDWAILNADDDNLKDLHKRITPGALYFGSGKCRKAAYPEGGDIVINTSGTPRRIINTDEIGIRGDHNLRNCLAACLVGDIFKIGDEDMAAALRDFKGLEHRFEPVDKIRGVWFVNDSKATTVDAASFALRSVKNKAVLIAGGKDKGSDFTVIRGLVREKARSLVLIGQAARKIREQLSGAAPISEAKDMEDAVSKGLDLAVKGDTVLLSPMCASFDMFRNFEERGRLFKQAVRGLKDRLESAPRAQCSR